MECRGESDGDEDAERKTPFSGIIFSFGAVDSAFVGILIYREKKPLCLMKHRMMVKTTSRVHSISNEVSKRQSSTDNRLKNFNTGS
jgi:hypothetical protein